MRMGRLLHHSLLHQRGQTLLLITVRVLDGAGRVRATLDKAREGHIVNIDREPTVE